MSNNSQQIFEQLGKPFTDDELEWRAQQVFQGNSSQSPKALVVPYVQSRAIMNRLDDVIGWDKWENLVQELPGGGIVQGIRIWLSDTHSITKWDGADRTNIESTKGGISSAFKRAAVLLNIGRYLYSETARWVEITPKKVNQNDQYIKDKKQNVTGYFTPPKLSGSNSNSDSSYTQGSQQSQQTQSRHTNQSNKQTQSQPTTRNRVPEGMIECTYRGVIEREGNKGKYLEIWIASNGDVAQIFAIGEVMNHILSLDLQDGDSIAIASHAENGSFFINDIVQIAAA